MISAGAPPQTPLGELTTLPQTPSRMGRGIPPPHTLHPSAPMAPRPSRLRRSSRRLRRLGPSLLTPSAFGCLTEAKAHPTSSFWRRHWSSGTLNFVPSTRPPLFECESFMEDPQAAGVIDAMSVLVQYMRSYRHRRLLTGERE